MRPVIDLRSDSNTYYESIKDASTATGVYPTTIVIACKRYEAGDHRVTPWLNVRGNQIINFWRWATPEEIAAHKQDSQANNN